MRARLLSAALFSLALAESAPAQPIEPTMAETIPAPVHGAAEGELTPSEAARFEYLESDDDLDGLENGEERFFGTELHSPDSDSDGFSDWEELASHAAESSDPLSPESIPEEPSGADAYSCGGEPDPVDELEPSAEPSLSFGESDPGMAAAPGDEGLAAPALECARAGTVDERLYDIDYGSIWSVMYGPGLAGKPCENSYSICFANRTEPTPRWFKVELMVRVGLKHYLQSMRNCLSGCPEVSRTSVTIDTVTDCDRANLVVYDTSSCPFIAAENRKESKSYGRPDQAGKARICLSKQANYGTVLHELGHAFSLAHVDFVPATVDTRARLYTVEESASTAPLLPLDWYPAPDPYGLAYAPIMSYGKRNGASNRRACFHPLDDEERICRMTAFLHQPSKTNLTGGYLGAAKACAVPKTYNGKKYGTARKVWVCDSMTRRWREAGSTMCSNSSELMLPAGSTDNRDLRPTLIPANLCSAESWKLYASAKLEENEPDFGLCIVRFGRKDRGRIVNYNLPSSSRSFDEMVSIAKALFPNKTPAQLTNEDRTRIGRFAAEACDWTQL